ncbi:hypothetical protein QBC40DRAFT_348902 [Triangularia verruculosa]|uniref:Uncharacterized protein n=1 Tax=Triangularia verruculosa TaxID=2587418 RepID=A0AAN6XGG0_9PEZI|nr:hypothetical protein QBC40DRAFT_348902 [Triangularia verruculosa]
MAVCDDEMENCLAVQPVAPQLRENAPSIRKRVGRVRAGDLLDAPGPSVQDSGLIQSETSETRPTDCWIIRACPHSCPAHNFTASPVHFPGLPSRWYEPSTSNLQAREEPHMASLPFPQLQPSRSRSIAVSNGPIAPSFAIAVDECASGRTNPIIGWESSRSIAAIQNPPTPPHHTLPGQEHQPLMEEPEAIDAVRRLDTAIIPLLATSGINLSNHQHLVMPTVRVESPSADCHANERVCEGCPCVAVPRRVLCQPRKADGSCDIRHTAGQMDKPSQTVHFKRRVNQMIYSSHSAGAGRKTTVGNPYLDNSPLHVCFSRMLTSAHTARALLANRPWQDSTDQPQASVMIGGQWSQGSGGSNDCGMGFACRPLLF